MENSHKMKDEAVFSPYLKEYYDYTYKNLRNASATF